MNPFAGKLRDKQLELALTESEAVALKVEEVVHRSPMQRLIDRMFNGEVALLPVAAATAEPKSKRAKRRERGRNRKLELRRAMIEGVHE